ncbi:MAG: FAD-dependent oxidoreductase [Odoribacteraceae bacterium]|jgi:glycine/D-amino acid oxidase-like deaminating enzyme/Fe-S-cluster-containing hydrogenase component 2/ferredoxin|nr:FAD-dependent oxidoreductase [Odoribacteraceae bacterium]
MQKITRHPILEIPARAVTHFTFNGTKIEGENGFTIAAALHRAGFPVHGHSAGGHPRSLACGIGKCGACEMLVDGKIRRVCVTKVDGVQEVREIVPGEIATRERPAPASRRVLHARVAIIGAGPAGLAAREEFEKHGIDTIVIDNNDKVGGQFNMQTHQFFFFEQAKRFGGMRGFDIARELAGENASGIYLNATVWDILEGKRLAVKNLADDTLFYVEADYLVVATGAVPFMPAFENDDLPGVYTAAVVQKMMNNELTLLGKRVLTVGAGNIGYLTSYQLMQAGATVKAIIEAMPREGGFPVQANRVRRLAIPVLTSRLLVKAIPNADRTGITGAVIARCENFQPVPGTESVIDGIDAINICTGLIPDNQLIVKGKAVFGERCRAAGDAVRIGEGTSAVLRGKQVAVEIMMEMGLRLDHDAYLALSREYIDSQQHPTRVLDRPRLPGAERRTSRPFVQIDCLYGFACNPCSFACRQGAITKNATSAVPIIDYDKCTGCLECISQCPGLAIFGHDLRRDTLFLPVEYEVNEREEVYLVNNNGEKVGDGIIEKITRKPNKTHVARVKALDVHGDALLEVRGFIVRSRYPAPLLPVAPEGEIPGINYVCHCEDIPLDVILPLVGDRPFISIDEIKHVTRLGMGPCRGKRCIPRLRALLRARGVELVGDATPRAPLSNQLDLGETSPPGREIHVIVSRESTRRVEVGALIAGGGIAGSALFRYMAEAGLKPLLLNDGHGSSWRNIAGGRTAFSLPELAEIAARNHALFKELQAIADIDYKPTRYVNLAHDEETYRALDASRAWSDARMIAPGAFRAEISPYFARDHHYLGALLTNDCWQATPGKVIHLLRRLGLAAGGTLEEECRVVDVKREGAHHVVLAKGHDGKYTEYRADLFVNAAGAGAGKLCESLGIQAGLYPVRHQAFITRPLPPVGKEGAPLDMLIDRRLYKGFSAVYGQQLAHTGQLIGCASPAVDPARVDKDLTLNTGEFIEIVSEIFAGWLPALANASVQATWSGYYIEPRYIIDPGLGLFIGLRGHGFMLSQYLAKMYVDKLLGRPVPSYFDALRLSGPGLSEKAFK